MKIKTLSTKVIIFSLSLLYGQQNSGTYLINLISPNLIPFKYNLETNQWSDALNITNPGGDDNCEITYDSENRKIIAVTNINNNLFADIYSPDDDTWEQGSSISTSGGLDYDEGLCYDSESNKVILMAFTSSGLKPFIYDTQNNIWDEGEYYGVGNHAESAVAYDSESDVAIYFKWVGSQQDIRAHSFDYNNNQWNQKTSSTHSGSLIDFGVTYDNESDRIVLVKSVNNYLIVRSYDYNSDSWSDDFTDFNVNDGVTEIDVTYDEKNDLSIVTVRNSDSENIRTFTYDLNTDIWTQKQSLDAGSSNYWVDLVYVDGYSKWHVSTTGSDNNNGSESYPFATIQRGIDVSSDGDTVLVQAGTYYENLNLNGKAIHIIGSNSDNTIIDGGQNGSVVRAEDLIQGFAKVEGFTIQNGSGTEEGWTDISGTVGGGLFIKYNNVHLEDLVIKNNTANDGGGAFMYSSDIDESDLSISNVHFLNNTALNNSGRSALAYQISAQSLSVINCDFQNNASSNSQQSEISSAIWGSDISLSIVSTTFSSNMGQLELYGGTAGPISTFDIRNTVFENNISATNGGALKMYGAFSATIDSSTFTNNQTFGEYGGGAMALIGDGEVNVLHTLIANNTSSDGGAIMCNSTSTVLSNCTIIGNTDTDTSPGLNASAILVHTGNESFTILNTILWGNVINFDDYNGGTLNISYSDIEGGESGILISDNNTGALNWGSGNINQDPIFCDQGNGDYTIDAISPCVGSGENGANIGAFDIGCSHDGPTWHVSTTGSDNNNGSESYPFATIQRGIDVSSDGDTVLVQAGTYYENLNLNGKAIHIIGSNSDNTIIDGGQNGSVVRAEDLIQGFAKVEGFTIQNGSGTEEGWTDISGTVGGGLFIKYNNVHLEDLVIKNNTANDGGGAFMYSSDIDESDLSISNVHFLNNTALNNSGRSALAYQISAQSLSVINCDFQNNASSNSQQSEISSAIWGSDISLSIVSTTFSSNMGQLELYGGTAGPISTFDIRNTVFENNISATNGGALKMYGAFSATIDSSTFTNNQTFGEYGGGAMALIGDGEVNVLHTLIANNTSSDGGAIMCNSTSTVLSNCTIIGNTDTDTSPGLNASAILVHTGNESFTILNTILWGNVINFDDYNGGTLNISYSDIEGGESGILISDNNTGALNWGSGNINQDPIFCDQGNGDYTIDAISPCVGSGENGANIGAFDIGCSHDGPTWHVSTTGSDDNDGSEENPFATIQHGIDAASDGDTVLVSVGTYEENINYNGKNIVVGSLTLINEDTSYVSLTIIDSTFGTTVSFGDPFQGTGVDSSAMLIGFTIKDASTGIFCSSYDNPRLESLHLNNNSIGITINKSSKVRNCIFSNNNKAIRLNYAYEENVEFKNVILKNNSTAIESDESNATFENCLFYSNNWEHFNRGNHIFMNCTFFENSGYFTWWNNGSLQVINSILWQNSFSFSYGNVSTPPSISYSSVEGGYDGTGNISYDPLFVHSESYNFNLLENSPCIDAGDPDLDSDGDDYIIDIDDQDPDGTRMDIGAYYFDQGLVAIISTEVPYETNSSNIPIVISFNIEPIGFSEDLFDLTNCSISEFESIDNQTFSFNLIPLSEGALSLILPEDALQNSLGYGNNEVLISFHFDSTLPTPTFAANITSPTNNSNLNAVLIFNEDVNGSLENGLSLINCSIDSLGRTDSSYTFEINPIGTGNVSLITNHGAFFDPAGNSNFSSDTLTFYYDNLPPDVNIVTPVQNDTLFIGDTLKIQWLAEDNYGLENVEITYLVDSSFIQIAEDLEDSDQFDWVLPNIVTENLSILISATDQVGLVDTAIISGIEVLPVYPALSFVEPLNNDTINIGDLVNITWLDSSSLGSINHEVSYNSGQGWTLIESFSDTNVTSVYWLVPNEPTDQLNLRLISENLYGYTDTTYSEGLVIRVVYPIITNVEPQESILHHTTMSLYYTISQPLDSNTITPQNVNIISALYETVSYELSYIDSNSTIKIDFTNGPIALDTIIVELKDGLQNLFGYSLDGDGDEIEGGSYTSEYHISMIGDYDKDFNITLDDLSQFVINWETGNYSEELGPFVGEMPHVYVSPDGDYNYHDMGAFALMWNWYYSTNTMSFTNYEDNGLPIIIEAEHDSIYLDIPSDLSAYQVQIQYTPGSFFIGNSDDKEGLFLIHQEQELGVYTIMAQPGQKQLVIPIEIRGKDADISISYKGITSQGELAGQMTKTMTIENVPDEFVLYTNYPNPFNPTTKIDYGLPNEANVLLVIYDILGREVITLANGLQEPGYKSITWNGTDALGRNVSAGMYFYLLQAGEFRQTRKMILLK